MSAIGILYLGRRLLINTLTLAAIWLCVARRALFQVERASVRRLY